MEELLNQEPAGELVTFAAPEEPAYAADFIRAFFAEEEAEPSEPPRKRTKHAVQSARGGGGVDYDSPAGRKLLDDLLSANSADLDREPFSEHLTRLCIREPDAAVRRLNYVQCDLCRGIFNIKNGYTGAKNHVKQARCKLLKSSLLLQATPPPPAPHPAKPVLSDDTVVNFVRQVLIDKKVFSTDRVCQFAHKSGASPGHLASEPFKDLLAEFMAFGRDHYNVLQGMTHDEMKEMLPSRTDLQSRLPDHTEIKAEHSNANSPIDLFEETRCSPIPTMSTENLIQLRASDLPIQSVLLYTDQAEVRREFEVPLKAGINKVVIENVSRRVQPDSIRAEGVGEARLLDVQYKERRAAPDDLRTEAERRTQARLDDLRDAAQLLEGKSSVFRRDADALDQLLVAVARPAAGHHFDEGLAQSVERAMDYHERQTDLLQAKLKAIEKQKKSVQAEIDALSRKLADACLTTEDKMRNVCVTLEAGAEGPSRLRLTYLVTSSWWQPSYEARLDAAASQLRLAYWATVSQDSGEDWTDVHLTLSTASPSGAGQLPTLRPVTAALHVAHARPHRYPQQDAPVMRAAMLMGPCNDMPAFQHEDAEPDHQLASTIYTVPQKRTIPSKADADTRVQIASLALDCDIVRMAVPAKSASVYLQAQLHNNTDFQLAEGALKVFVGNSLTNELHLPARAPGERFPLTLGVDAGVQLEHRPPKQFQQHAGLLSSTACTTHEQHTVLTNHKSEPVRLTVQLQVPTSTDERIKVKLVEPSVKQSPTPEAEHEKPHLGPHLTPDNILQWTVDLEPGQKRDLLLKYTVDHPASQQVDFHESH